MNKHKFSEKDIEAAAEDSFLFSSDFFATKRQVRLMSGIADIIAFHSDIDYERNSFTITPLVVEIKKGEIDGSACAQILGYMEQVNILLESINYNHVIFPSIGWLIGSRLEKGIPERLVSVMKSLYFIPYKINPDREIRFSMDRIFSGYNWANSVPDILEHGNAANDLFEILCETEGYNNLLFEQNIIDNEISKREMIREKEEDTHDKLIKRQYDEMIRVGENGISEYF